MLLRNFRCISEILSAFQWIRIHMVLSTRKSFFFCHFWFADLVYSWALEILIDPSAILFCVIYLPNLWFPLSLRCRIFWNSSFNLVRVLLFSLFSHNFGSRPSDQLTFPLLNNCFKESCTVPTKIFCIEGYLEDVIFFETMMSIAKCFVYVVIIVK